MHTQPSEALWPTHCRHLFAFLQTVQYAAPTQCKLGNEQCAHFSANTIQQVWEKDWHAEAHESAKEEGESALAGSRNV